MLHTVRQMLGQLRRGLVNAAHALLARLEPHDPTHLASQLERGAIVWRAFVDAGVALRGCNRFEEADGMLERGLGAFPDDRTLLFEYAMSAHDSGRYDLAITRWKRALHAAPDLAMCHCGLAANLRETGLLAEAQHTIEAALTLFPEDLVVMSEAARVADARGAFAEALPLWRHAARSPNPPPEWVQGEAHALFRLGRYRDAEAALAAGRLRFPHAPGLMAVEGLLAAERWEWPKAVAIWSTYRQRFPDDDLGRDQLERAVTASRRLMPADDAPGVASGSVLGSLAEGYHNLLLGFESIGDCPEFGAVLGRCAVERPGLLRRSSLTLDALISALEQRFAGLGDPANTELGFDPHGEYIATDRRWRLAIHTRRFAGQVEPDTFFETMCQRIADLKERFVVDLTAAERIFVYRSEGLDGDGLEALHRALCAFGPVRLLSVQPAAPTAPTLLGGRAGDVLTIDRDRQVGFLERLGLNDGGIWTVAIEDWLSVCRKAAAR